MSDLTADVLAIIKSISSGDLLTWVITYFVDALILSYFIYTFYNIKAPKGYIIITAFIYSVCILLVRKTYIFYKIQFGSHSIILAILFMLIVFLVYKLPLMRSAIGSVACFAMIYLASPVIIKLISISGINLELVAKQPLLLALIGYTEDIFIIISILFMKFTGFNYNKLLEKI